MPKLWWPLLCLALAVAQGTAVAQTPLTTFDGGALGYRIGYPSGWVLDGESDGSYLNIQPPQGSAAAGRAAIELLADPNVTGTLEQGVEDVLAELQANLLPDLAVQARTPSAVSGVPAVVVRLTGTVDGSQPVTYRLVLTLQGTTGYVLFLEAVSEDFAALEPLFDQVQASFALTASQAAPGAPVAPTSPLAPASPLAPSAGAATYAGTFAGDQLRLVLEGPSTPGGAYLGTLQFGDQQYPVRAQLDAQGLAGDFESDGNRFAFTATLVGDQLTFVTDGNRFVLAREDAAPVNPIGAPPAAPVNPIGAPPAAPATPVAPAAPVAPVASAEVVATETGTAFVGALPANGRARGRLDGAADRITFHTYVVEVPAGAARLTIELDADTDLDIAIKQGSEIQSYANLDQGGDWDYRDIGTQNPTSIVIDRPLSGPLYVDVMNALGAGQNGTYRLTVTTGGF